MRHSARCLAAWLAFLGCRQAPVAAPSRATGVVVLDASFSHEVGPPEGIDASIKTNAGKLAVGNLEGQIREISKITDAPRRASALTDLVALLGARAQFLGRVEDYELALDDANELVALTPKDPKAYLTRAHARSSLHLFKEALEDLDQAKALQKHPDRSTDIDDQRAGIWQAMGRTADAVAIAPADAPARSFPRPWATLGRPGRRDGRPGQDRGGRRPAGKGADRVPQRLTFPGGLDGVPARPDLGQRQGQPAKAIAYYRAATGRLPASARRCSSASGWLDRGRRRSGLRGSSGFAR